MHSLWYLHPFRLPSDHAHSIQILNTCRALAQAGARVRLMVKRNPDRRVRSVEEGLAFYGLKPHGNLQIDWLPAHKGIAGLVARFRVRRAKDRPVFYARHLRLAVTAVKRGPVVVELHAIEKDTERAVAKAAGIVTITSPLADEVRKRFAPAAPFEVIPDAVDLATFRPPERDGPPRLVYAGQFHDWKGVDILVRALAKLPGMTALILGGRGGRREELQALAEDVGVADRIEWGGFVPQAEIPGRLTRGDIGVVPTRAMNGQEIAASPLKLFEYMACGLPVVASDLPSMRDVVRDVLFREGDPDALAAAAKRAIENRPALSRRSLEESRKHSWPERARRILSFVERVCR